MSDDCRRPTVSAVTMAFLKITIKKSSLTFVNCLFRQAHTTWMFSNSSLLDVWEVSIFKTVPKLPAAVDYHLLLLEPCQQKCVPWEFTHVAVELYVSVSVSVWCFAWLVVSHTNSLQSSNSFPGWCGFFCKPETWTPWALLRLFKFYALFFLGLCVFAADHEHVAEDNVEHLSHYYLSN